MSPRLSAGGLVPLGGKPRHVGGASDFDALLDIIEEDEKPKKKASKTSSKSKAKSSSSSSKDKEGKSKKSSSKKGSSTSSKVSKSSLSSKAGSRSSDDDLMLSSDDLADVDIEHDAAARPRTASLERANAYRNTEVRVIGTEEERPRSAGASVTVGSARRGPGFDPLTPTKEGSETEQSPGQSQVLSFFREDSGSKASGGDELDALSSDLSDILGVSMKPSRVVGRRRGASAREEEEKAEREREREEELQRAREEEQRAELERKDKEARLQQEQQLRLERAQESREAARRAEEAQAAAAAEHMVSGTAVAGGLGIDDDEVEEHLGASSFAEDSPPLTRKSAGGGASAAGGRAPARYLPEESSPKAAAQGVDARRVASRPRLRLVLCATLASGLRRAASP